ncbi:hypothetical protein KA057_02860 [Candidatus Gracilibacteria bacterium]|nr:hypothetical protein [Candidatus Gracilibacteria bacterium]
MQTLFSSLDALLDLPFPAFEKKLTKFEEDFRNISISDVSEEELDSYFSRIKEEYDTARGDGAKTRLSTLGYLSHFDTLVEKFFPDYVALFQQTLDRDDAIEMAPINYGFLEHMDEILREYTHRLSDPDNYPSYTDVIQELVQNSMIDLFFWLQDRETAQEKTAKIEDKNTDIYIQLSSETKNPELRITRKCLELLNEGVLEKIFFDHEYPIRVSPIDAELQLIGRYERKK